MSGTHDPATDDAVAVAVELTIRQHEGDGTTWKPGACRQCEPDRVCPQLAWALSVRQRLHQQAQARITAASTRRP